MGRVNIVYKLLSFLRPKHFLKYISRICRKSKYEQGDLSVSLVALLTMLCNTKEINVSSVISLLIDPKHPFSRIYGNIVLRVKKDRVLNYLSAIYRGASYVFTTSEFFKNEVL